MVLGLLPRPVLPMWLLRFEPSAFQPWRYFFPSVWIVFVAEMYQAFLPVAEPSECAVSGFVDHHSTCPSHLHNMKQNPLYKFSCISYDYVGSSVFC